MHTFEPFQHEILNEGLQHRLIINNGILYVERYKWNKWERIPSGWNCKQIAISNTRTLCIDGSTEWYVIVPRGQWTKLISFINSQINQQL